jgi:ABC-type transport system involved in multi-copper enzyme maturation permease subunit
LTGSTFAFETELRSSVEFNGEHFLSESRKAGKDSPASNSPGNNGTINKPMSQLSLFAVEPWVNFWLTPIWILGLGALAGLIGLLVVWGIAAFLSGIPFLGTLADHRELRNKVAVILGVVIVGISLPYSLWAAAGSISVLFAALILTAIAAVILPSSIIAFVSRRTVLEVPMTVREGPLWPILIVTLNFAVFGIVGALAVNPRDRMDILQSLPRLPYAGTTTQVFSLDAPAASDAAARGAETTPEQTIDVSIRGKELHKLVLKSNQTLQLSVTSFSNTTSEQILDIPAGEEVIWLRSAGQSSLSADELISKLYVRNFGDRAAKLEMTVVTAPVYPEVAAVPITALSIMLVFLLYVLQNASMPKLSAVALSTSKSEIAQPMFLLMLIVGAVLIFIFVYVPYFTLGSDIKMLKDSGLTLILVLGIFLAVWAASTSVSEEIEGRTALTVLSKPIGRRDFILGKFLGIAWSVAVLFVVLGAWFCVWVAFKPIYDARESSTEASWQLCYLEMIRIVPGLALAFMETLVLAAISVAISTRLPMLPNFIISFAIYVLGHLTPLMVQSSVVQKQFELVTFVGKLIATVFPVLEHFNIQPAIAAGAEVPYDYLGWSLLYCVLYGTIAMLLALVMFEDRDLA